MWQLKKQDLKKLSPTEFVEIFDVATPRKQRELAKRGVETAGRYKRSSVTHMYHMHSYVAYHK